MEASFLAGLIGLAALVLLIAIRVPIAYTMILVGGAGIVWQSGPAILLFQLKDLGYTQFANYDLSVLPMFVLDAHGKLTVLVQDAPEPKPGQVIIGLIRESGTEAENPAIIAT